MTTAIRRAPTRAAHTEDWRAYAACATVDPDLHFPIPHTNGWKKQTTQAKAICARCPSRTACLEWAIATAEPEGIWGGKSVAERRKLRDQPESQTERCMNQQAWIEKQVAAGMPQREIARRLGVERATLCRALARFEAERVAAEGVRAS
ncbi:WhiB family transcriptional regulator [Streptomyces sp. NPDC055966]|uniref:WhiB family transcriptional regulator n=1 Tax=Streptomyces sp. NPDC055966 TaxID=3345669 RepID=UPI0035DAE5F8